PLDLLLQRCLIALQECNVIKARVKVCGINFLCDSSLIGLLSFFETVEIDKYTPEVCIPVSKVWVESNRLTGLFARLFVLANVLVINRENIVRNVITRIGPFPQLQHLNIFLCFPGGVPVILRRDVQFLALAYPIAECKCLFRKLSSKFQLAAVVVDDGKLGIRECEIGIQLDCTSVERDCFKICGPVTLLVS